MSLDQRGRDGAAILRLKVITMSRIDGLPVFVVLQPLAGLLYAAGLRSTTRTRYSRSGSR